MKEIQINQYTVAIHEKRLVSAFDTETGVLYTIKKTMDNNSGEFAFMTSKGTVLEFTSDHGATIRIPHKDIIEEMHRDRKKYNVDVAKQHQYYLDHREEYLERARRYEKHRKPRVRTDADKARIKQYNSYYYQKITKEKRKNASDPIDKEESI